MQTRVRTATLRASGEPAKFGALEYGFWIFLMIAVGRVGELIPGLTAVPIVKITLGITLLILVKQWKSLPRLTLPAKSLGRTAIWLAVIAVALTPISYWRGASFAFLYQELPILIATTVIAYKVSRSWGAVRGTLLALVLSGLVLARAALTGYTGGRAAVASMYDTNDLAYLLVTVFPLALGFAITATTTLWRSIYAGIAGAFVIAMLLTSSRGGFLGLAVIAVLLVFLPVKAPPPEVATAARSKQRKKKGGGLLMSLLLLVCATAVIWPQLPKDTRERFASLVDLGNDYNLDPNNEKSRGRIWTRGAQATVKRPFGHGPRAFAMVDLRYGGKMMAPHNSLLQAAVELGVIGLILFVMMYVRSWRGLGRVRQGLLARAGPLTKEQQDQVVFARMIQLGLIGNLVAGFFLTMAYATVLWTLFGACMALIAVGSPSTGEVQQPLRAGKR
jgi:O-antigen ligase